MADIKLQKPAANENITITPKAEELRIALDFETGEAEYTRHGDNFVFTFKDESTGQENSITLTDFYKTYSSENMPTFLVGDAELDGEAFFGMIGEDLMPAAGSSASAAPMSGGSSVDILNFGANFFEGVDRLGGLDQSFADDFLLGGFDTDLTVNAPPSIAGFVSSLDGVNVDALTAIEDGVGLDPANPNAAYDGVTSITGQVVARDPEGLGLTYSVAGQSSEYGTLTIDGNSGAFVFTIDSDKADSLSAGQGYIEQILIEVSDGVNTVQGVIEITVLGTNDRPTLEFVSTPTNSVPVYDVQAEGLQVEGQVQGFDVDSLDVGYEDGGSGMTLTYLASSADEFDAVNGADNGSADDDLQLSTSALTNQTAGKYGDFVISGDGSFTYTQVTAGDPRYADLQALNDVDTNGVETFYVYVQDASGAWASQEITINVSGVNDEPVITSTEHTHAFTEDAAPYTVEGQVTATDADAGQDVFTYTVDKTDGAYGSIVVDTDGTYTYTFDNDQSLVGGQSYQDTFTVTGINSNGETVTQTITIDITGTNDAPVLTSGVQEHSFTEDSGTVTATGTITATDADAGQDVFTYTVDKTDGAYGSIVVDTDGTYTYTFDNANHQSLAQGQKVQDTFTVTGTNSNGETVTQTITIDITGTNDAPQISVVAGDNQVVDGSDTTASGTWTVDDVDSDGAIQTITAKDGTGSIDRDADGVSGSITVVGTYGTLVVNADGTYDYTTGQNQAQIDALKALSDEKVVEKFTLTTTDAHNATGTVDINVDVYGVHDAPVVEDDAITVKEAGVDGTTNAADPNAVEGGEPYRTAILPEATDVDGDTLTYTLVGTGEGKYGNIVFNPTTREYTYTVDQDKSDSIAEGNFETDIFTVAVFDGTKTTNVTITVTINGTNDLPEISVASDNTSVTDGSDTTASGTWTVDDVDSDGAIQTITAKDGTGSIDRDADGVSGSITVVGTYGTLVVNADGTYDYTTGQTQAQIDALKALGIESVTEKFTLTTTDDNNSTDSVDINITVNGINDAPEIVVGSDTSANSEAAYLVEKGDAVAGTAEATGSIIFTDVDVDDKGHYLKSGDVEIDTAKVYNVVKDGDSYKLVEGTEGTMPDEALAQLTFTKNEDNRGFSYTAKLNDENETVNGLAQDESLPLPSVTVFDGNGGESGSFGLGNITGSNDVPTVDVASDTFNLYEHGVGREQGTGTDISDKNPNKDFAIMDSDAGKLVFTDVDGDSLNYSVVGETTASNVTEGAIGSKAGDTMDKPTTTDGTIVLTDDYGTFTYNPATGDYDYVLKHGTGTVLAKLGHDDEIVKTFTVTADDGNGGSVSSVITVNIHGTNDKPSLSIKLDKGVDKKVTEDSADQSVTGSLTVVDVDTDGDTLAEQSITVNGEAVDTVTANASTIIVGTYGNLEVNADGTFKYTLGGSDEQNKALDALNVGDTPTEKFVVKTTDAHGATDSSTLNITVNGANDAPTIEINREDTNLKETGVGDTGKFLWTTIDLPNADAPKSDANASGSIVLNDVDDALSALTLHSGSTEIVAGTTYYLDADGNLTDSAPADHVGTVVFTQTANGYSYDFTLNNDSETINEIPKGGSEDFKLNLTVKDDAAKAGENSADLVFTVQGTNDMPTLSVTNKTINEDDASVVGQAEGFDIDGDSLTYLVSSGYFPDALNLLGDAALPDKISLFGKELAIIDNKALGVYGTLGIDANGKYTYTPHDFAQTLDDGEFGKDTFTVYVKDEHNAWVAKELTFEVKGSNDAPVISELLTTTHIGVQEAGVGDGDGDKLTVPADPNAAFAGTPSDTGKVTAFDIDGDKLTYTFAPDADNPYGDFGTFSIDKDTGVFRFDVNTDPKGAANKLAEGESKDLVFIVTVFDGTVSVTQEVTVTVTGTNDLPSLKIDKNKLTVGEDDAVSEAVKFYGWDIDEDAVDFAVTVKGEDVPTSFIDSGSMEVEGKYGTFTIDRDTKEFTFTPNDDAQSLGEGETGIESFTIYVRDEYGAYVSKDVKVVVEGKNDQPTIEINREDTNLKETGVGDTGKFLWTTIDLPNAEAPKADDTANGSIELNDIDTTDILTLYSGAEALTAGTTYYVVLVEGDDAGTQYKLVDSLDGYGDHVGTVELTAQGKSFDYIFKLNNESNRINQIPEDEEFSFDIKLVVKDDSGVGAGDADSEKDSAEATLSFTVKGTNDMPTLSVTNKTINEDDASVVGQAVGFDIDGDSLTYLVSSGYFPDALNLLGDAALPDKISLFGKELAIIDNKALGVYGTLGIDANGKYTYTLHDFVQTLDDGETREDKFTVYVKDEHDAWVAKELTFKVEGSNDAPVISDSLSTTEINVREEGVGIGNSPNLYDIGKPVALGQIVAADVDIEKLTFSVEGLTSITSDKALFDVAYAHEFGTLYLNSETGSYMYELDQDKADKLNEGEVKTFDFKFVVSDDQGDGSAVGTDSVNVNLTITGTNDKPVLSVTESNLVVTDNIDNPHMDGGKVVEGVAASASGKATSTDVDRAGDLGDTETFSVGYVRPEFSVIEGIGKVLDKLDIPFDQAVLDKVAGLTADAYESFASLPTEGTTVKGLYGYMTIDAASGEYTYTLYTEEQAAEHPVTEAAYWALQMRDDTDEALPTENFTIYVKDKEGAWDEQQVSVTVKGANDTPVIHYATETLTVQEAGVGIDIGGHFAPNASDPGKPAALGQIVASDIDIEKLTFGIKEAGDDSTAGKLSLSDLAGGISLPQVMIDALVKAGIYDDVESVVDAEVFPYDTTVSNEYGTLYLNATTGTYVFVIDNDSDAVQALDEGDTVPLEFTITVSDGTATVEQEITVNVEGTNDKPILSATASDLSVNENLGEVANSSSVGTVSFSDVDANDEHTLSLTITRPEQGNETLQSIVDSLLDVVGVQAGSVLDSMRDVVEKLHETLASAPENTLLGQIPGMKYGDTETLPDGSQVIYGLYGYMTLNTVDAEAGEEYSYQYTLYTWDEAKGSVDTMAAYLALQHRDDGDTALPTENFTITVQDKNGAWDSHDVTVTVNGVNDAPTVIVPTDSVTEAGVGNDVIGGAVEDAVDSIIAGIFENDALEFVDSTLIDLDGIKSSLEATLKGAFEGLESDISANFPNAGDDEANGKVTITDDDGNPLVIVGDKPAISEFGFNLQGFASALLANFKDLGLDFSDALSLGGLITDAGSNLSGLLDGNISAGDIGELIKGAPDLLAKLGSIAFDTVNLEAILEIVRGSITQTVRGEYGTLTMYQDGSYEYTLLNDDPDTQALNTGESKDEIFTIKAYDKFGQQTEEELVITVNGTNDKPTFSETENLNLVINEDEQSVSGKVTASDVDQGGDIGDKLTYFVGNPPTVVTLDDYLNEHADNISGSIIEDIKVKRDAEQAKIDAIYDKNVGSLKDAKTALEDAKEDAKGINDKYDQKIADLEAGKVIVSTETLDGYNTDLTDLNNQLNYSIEIPTKFSDISAMISDIASGKLQMGLNQQLELSSKRPWSWSFDKDEIQKEIDAVEAEIDRITPLRDAEQTKVNAANEAAKGTNDGIDAQIDEQNELRKNDLEALEKTLNETLDNLNDRYDDKYIKLDEIDSELNGGFLGAGGLNNAILGAETVHFINPEVLALLATVGVYDSLIASLEGSEVTEDAVLGALKTLIGEEFENLTEYLNLDDVTENLDNAHEGQYGTLTINSSTGDYEYTRFTQDENPEKWAEIQALGEGESKTETFTIYVKDELGAWSHKEVQVTITGVDDAPVITAPADIESSDATMNTAIPGTIVFKAFESMDDGIITIEGVEFKVTETKDADGVGTGGFTVAPVGSVTEAGSGYGDISVTGLEYNSVTQEYTLKYTYTQDTAFTHGDTSKHDEKEDNADTFNVTIKDGKGAATDTVTVKVNITDDGPEVVADTFKTTEGESNVGGNVLTDDKSGADGWAVGGGLVAIKLPDGWTAPAGNTADTDGWITLPATGLTFTSEQASITFNKDGSYTFSSTDDAYVHENPVFGYKVEDGDGDVATSTLTVSVTDVATPVTITLTAPDDVTEGDTTASREYTITVSEAPATDLTVTLSNNVQVTIAAGELSTTYTDTRNIRDDNVFTNNDDTLSLTITGHSGVNYESVSYVNTDGSYNVIDDTDVTALTLTANVTEIVEGQNITYTVALPDGVTTKEDLVVTLNVNGTTETVTILANTSSATYTTKAVLDNDGNFVVKITGTDNVTTEVNNFEGLSFDDAETSVDVTSAMEVTSDPEDLAVSVDEANLGTGTDPNALLLTKTGTVELDSNADITSIKIGSTEFKLTDGWTGSAPVDNGSVSIKSVTETTDGKWIVTYAYTLDEAEDGDAQGADTSPTFKMDIIDANGSSVAATVEVTIVDDAPEVLSVVDSYGNVDLTFDKNSSSLNGEVKFDFGADDDGKSITIGEYTATWSEAAGKWTVAQNGKDVAIFDKGDPIEFGSITLTPEADNTWKIENANIGTEVIITDGDGDEASFTLDAHGELVTDETGANMVFVVDLSKSTTDNPDYIDGTAKNIMAALEKIKASNPDEVNVELVLFGSTTVSFELTDYSEQAIHDLLSKYDNTLGEGSNLTSAVSKATDIVNDFEGENNFPTNVVIFSDGGTTQDQFTNVIFDDIKNDFYDKNVYDIRFDISSKDVGDVWIAKGDLFNQVGHTGMGTTKEDYVLRIEKGANGEYVVVAETASLADITGNIATFENIAGDGYGKLTYDIQFDLTGREPKEGESWIAKGELFNDVGNTSMGKTLSEYELTYVKGPDGELVLHAALAPQKANVDSNNIARFDDILVDGYDKNVYDIEFDTTGKNVGDTWIAKGDLYNQVGNTSMGQTLTEYVLTLKQDANGDTYVEVKKDDTANKETVEKVDIPKTAKFGDIPWDGYDTGGFEILFDISDKQPGQTWVARGIAADSTILDRTDTTKYEYELTLKVENGNLVLSATALNADGSHRGNTVNTSQFSDAHISTFDKVSSAKWDSHADNTATSKTNAEDALEKLENELGDDDKLIIMGGGNLILPNGTIKNPENFDDLQVGNNADIEGTDRDDVLIGGMTLEEVQAATGSIDAETIIEEAQKDPAAFIETLENYTDNGKPADDGKNDILNGNDGDDILIGLAGDDSLFGGDGADSLFGGDGADSLFGNDGDDMLFGGVGDLKLDGGAGNDIMNLPTLEDVLHTDIDGGAGIDILLAGIENLEAAKQALESKSVDSVEIIMFGKTSDMKALDAAEKLQEELAGKDDTSKIDEDLKDAGWSTSNSEHTIGGATFREYTNGQTDDADKLTILVNTQLLS